MAITACLLWSTAFVSLKIGLRYSEPLHLAGIRFMLAGLMILPFCKNLKYNIHELWDNKVVLLKVSLFQTFGLYSLFHLGIKIVPASVTALIVGAGPLFIALFARMINNESISTKKVVAIAVGFAGIAVIAVGGTTGLLETHVPLVGIIILIVSNMSGSLGNVIFAKNKTAVSPVFFNSVQQFTGGFGILILSFFFEGFQFKIQPAEYYTALLWLSFIAAAGFSLWFIVLNKPGIQVSEVNIWKFIVPVIGGILSWIILPDEKPEIIVIAGMILVSISLIIMFYKPSFIRKYRRQTD